MSVSGNPIYLDYNATAPIKPAVIERMADTMAVVGNPSSVHGSGRKVRLLVDQARQQVAALVEAPSAATIIFTCGGTEANNQALAGVDGAILTSAIEHESVLRAADDLEPLPVDQHGQVDLEALEETCRLQSPKLISVMLANNETGVIQPIVEISRIAKACEARLHVDAVQAAGKIAISLEDLGADYLTLSAHKFGGPQGVGALIIRPGLEPSAILKGGAQENRFRAGTENVAGIAGFGLAAELALYDTSFGEKVTACRDRMEKEILTISPHTQIFGAEVLRLPNTSCLTMPGVSHETQLIAFDLAGIAVSSGSACSSGKVGPSHVLAAMGVPESDAATAIRVSFGWASSTTEVSRFVEVYHNIQERRRARQRAG